MRVVMAIAFLASAAVASAGPAELLAAMKARPPEVPRILAAFDELVAKHPGAPQVAEACVHMLFFPPEMTVPRMRTVLAGKVSHEAAGLARFVLARQILDDLSNTPPGGRQAAVDEATRFLKEVVSAYADVKLGEKLAKEHAEHALYEIEHLLPGKPAPEVSGEDLDGKPMKLSEFRGRVVLLSFWGAWCRPCVMALPHERAVADRFAGKPFVVVGVNTDHDAKVARGVAAENGVTWRSFRDGSQIGPISSAYNVTGFPMLYVIDRQGVIRHRDVPPDQDALAVLIEELLEPSK